MSNGFIRNWKLKIAIHVFLILLTFIIFIAYWFVLHPIVSWIFFPPIEHSGADLFTSGKYLMFEDGKLFSDAIDSLGFTDKCIITDFYYYDTRARDNPFYRKMCDTYCLDLQAGKNYEKIVAQVLHLSNECDYRGNFVLHLVSDPNTSTEHIIVAINDNTSVIRCLMITERIPPDYDFAGTLNMHSGLEWE